jgi:mannan endo-1,4-beta-mannosidase
LASGLVAVLAVAGLVAGLLVAARPADAGAKPASKLTVTTTAPTTAAAPTPTTTLAPTTTVAPPTTVAPTSSLAPPTTTVAAAPSVTSTEAEAEAEASTAPAAETTGSENPASTAPSSGGMLIGTRNAGAAQPQYGVAAMNAWQGKPNAVAQLYVRSTWTPAAVIPALEAIWSGGSVPSVSYDLQVTNVQVVAGQIDPNLEAVAAAVRTWLAGADGDYGTPDDKRAYFRPAWEANGNWYRWSPCYYAGGTGTAADYRAMWRHLHGKFRSIGIDSSRLAWIYSVNSADKVATCSAEALYPGDAYVDWTGIDGYTHSSAARALDVFEPMALRLGALAPTKPLSINEWGSDSTSVMGGKSAWIDAQFGAAHQLGARMNVVFNIDKERDWAVFGGSGGDETFTFAGRTHTAWSAYRRNVADPRIVGADPANPRLLTDAQFQGQ